MTDEKREQEKIRKFLINEVMGHLGVLDIEGDKIVNNTKNELWRKALTWLEKKKIKEHDVCDTCDEKASCVNPCPTKLIEEQKPADKVEPIEGEFPYVNPADTLEGEIDNIWRNVSCDNRFTATKEGFEEVIRHFINFAKQKPAMSEEDNAMLISIENILIGRGHSFHDKEINWLKSLRPKSQWRPSDEQMEALKSSTYCQNKQMSKVLFELYQDLKKLTEE